MGIIISVNQLNQESEVQFKDPGWWRHLPSLKCIGLACLLVDDDKYCHQRNDREGKKDEGVSAVLENEKSISFQGKYEVSMDHSSLILSILRMIHLRLSKDQVLKL